VCQVGQLPRILDMFRAVPCSSAESALNRHTIQPFTESDDTRCCNNTIWPPEDEHGTAQNMSRIITYHIYCYRIKELCIKLVNETSLNSSICGKDRMKWLIITLTLLLAPWIYHTVGFGTWGLHHWHIP